MPKERVVLIGFRATGKTTIGQLLAQRLEWPFVDLDHLIQEQLGQSIAEIVQQRGWAYFREREREALEALSFSKPMVLACGGGAVLHQRELENLAKDSLVVWLKAPIEVIRRRLQADQKTKTQRPSLTNKGLWEELEALLDQRTPLYQHFAHLIVDTAELLPEEAVEFIEKSLRQRALA